MTVIPPVCLLVNWMPTWLTVTYNCMQFWQENFNKFPKLPAASETSRHCFSDNQSRKTLSEKIVAGVKLTIFYHLMQKYLHKYTDHHKHSIEQSVVVVYDGDGRIS